MRFGCCGPIEQAADMKAAGFDYIEINARQVLRGDLPSDQWLAAAPDPAHVALPMETANILVPPTLPVVGVQRSLPALRQYMERVAQRGAELGVTLLVFGSPDARRAPAGFPLDEAADQVAEFVALAADICGQYQVDFLIEQLNKTECNTVSSLDEAAELCDRVGHPRVGLVADSYHICLQGEEDDALLQLGDRIRHAHVAEPVGRSQPGGHGAFGATPDAYDFEHFFCLLRKIGYDQRVSIEATGWTGSIAQAGPAANQYLRQAWERSAEKACEF